MFFGESYSLDPAKLMRILTCTFTKLVVLACIYNCLFVFTEFIVFHLDFQ